MDDDFISIVRQEIADKKVASDRGVSIYRVAAERQFFEVFAFVPGLWSELGLLGKVVIFPLAMALWLCVMLPVTLVFGVAACFAVGFLEDLAKGGWFWKVEEPASK